MIEIDTGTQELLCRIEDRGADEAPRGNFGIHGKARTVVSRQHRVTGQVRSRTPVDDPPQVLLSATDSGVVNLPIPVK